MNERALRAAMAVAKATRNPGLRSWLNTAFLAQCDELNEALSIVAREDEITQKVTVPDTTHSTRKQVCPYHEGHLMPCGKCDSRDLSDKNR